MAKSVTAEEVLEALGPVSDPALGESLVSANLVRGIKVKGDEVSLNLILIAPQHPHLAAMEEEITKAVSALDGVSKVKITPTVEVPADGKLTLNNPKATIKTLIAVASGKGGVGKTTVSVNLAAALAKSGAKVGLMDADVYGPNVPTMMGVKQLPPQDVESGRLVPAEAFGVKMISIGFMVRPEQPIVWRGPMLHSAIRQFIQDVDWGDLDYLVVDLPPGTGDAQLSLAQTISITGGLIVTLPQQVSLDDARRGLEMFRQLEIPILGVVENMSFLELADGQTVDIFGAGGGEKLAREANVDFIGAVPIDPAVREGGDAGEPILISNPDSPVSKALSEVAIAAALRAGALAHYNQSQAVPIKIIN